MPVADGDEGLTASDRAGAGQSVERGDGKPRLADREPGLAAQPAAAGASTNIKPSLFLRRASQELVAGPDSMLNLAVIARRPLRSIDRAMLEGAFANRPALAAAVARDLSEDATRGRRAGEIPCVFRYLGYGDRAAGGAWPTPSSTIRS
jgi:hypothetical protein